MGLSWVVGEGHAHHSWPAAQMAAQSAHCVGPFFVVIAGLDPAIQRTCPSARISVVPPSPLSRGGEGAEPRIRTMRGERKEV